MITLHFKDGGTITSKEVATLLRKEERLGRFRFIDWEGLRCLTGALQDWKLSQTSGRAFTRETALDLHRRKLDYIANDTFKGTPEERCAHFAQLFEQL